MYHTYRTPFKIIELLVLFNLVFHFGCLITCCQVNEVTGEDKCTLLHLAVDVGRVDFIELLCRFGGDVNSADRLGELPLHYAVKRSV